MGARPAVFLDRDGTLHRELEHAPREPAQLELFPGVEGALQRLSRAGFALVVITNQSAVAAGEVTFDELGALHAALARRLPIEAFYLCPHHPERGAAPYLRICQCRKPGSALLRWACADRDLDPRRSWIVGDARRDLEAGLALGLRALLVATGKGQRERSGLSAEFARRVAFVPDLAAAAEHILAAP